MNIRRTNIYKTMDPYTACSIAEGFCEGDPTEKELHAAWQYLVDTGMCWTLQGWYGRNAADMIDSGVLVKART